MNHPISYHKDKFYLGGMYLNSESIQKGLELYHHRIFFHNDFKETTRIFDYSKHLIHTYNNFDNKIIEDGTIYIVLEQGYGDIFMWVRYLLYFSNCRLYIMVSNNYHKRIIRSLDYTLRLCSINRKIHGIKYVKNDVILVDEVNNDYDYWINICDLSICFGFPDIQCYIRPDVIYSNKWEQFINNISCGKRVIALNLNSIDKESDYRSVKMEFLIPTLNLNDFVFININKDMKIDHPNVLNIPNIDTDWSFCDTSSIIEKSCCTLSVDTSTIHLSGAIGSKTILMIPGKKEWRWLPKNNKWYKNLKIIEMTSIESFNNSIYELIRN